MPERSQRKEHLLTVEHVRACAGDWDIGSLRQPGVRSGTPELSADAKAWTEIQAASMIIKERMNAYNKDLTGLQGKLEGLHERVVEAEQQYVVRACRCWGVGQLGWPSTSCVWDGCGSCFATSPIAYSLHELRLADYRGRDACNVELASPALQIRKCLLCIYTSFAQGISALECAFVEQGR